MMREKVTQAGIALGIVEEATGFNPVGQPQELQEEQEAAALALMAVEPHLGDLRDRLRRLRAAASPPQAIPDDPYAMVPEGSTIQGGLEAIGWNVTDVQADSEGVRWAHLEPPQNWRAVDSRIRAVQEASRATAERHLSSIDPSTVPLGTKFKPE